MEHPSATLPDGERRKFGQVVRRVSDARALTTLMISMDPEFSTAAAQRVLTLEPGTGMLKGAVAAGMVRLLKAGSGSARRSASPEPPASICG